jgi:RNA polymerase sigma factor (sigma-70 family)
MSHQTSDGAKLARDAHNVLVAATRRGDEQAVAEIYRVVAPVVFYTAWRMVRSCEADRQDVAQNAFELFFRTLREGTYEGRCTLTRWAGFIAARVATDHHRKQARFARVFANGEMTDEVPNRESGLEANLLARSELRRLERTFARRKPIDLDVLVLFCGCGYSLQETAVAVGSTTDAACARLGRARRRLLRGQRSEKKDLTGV